MPEQLVELVTIPDVELLEVGEWECSTGILVCTVEDLAACVGAQDDPAVRTPIIKLGHVDPRFDGEPSVGRVENLRLSDDRMTLIGDLVGVPRWLAEVIPSAFPSRSIEATKSYTTNTGTRHQMVLTALALLGVSVPAIETLEDIQSLYGVVAAAAPDGRGEPLVIRPKGATMPEPVRASVPIDQVRAEFYETQPPGSWAWIREVWSDFIIVDNDEGDLYRIPWSEGTNQDVTFGTPERVQVEYVPAPADDDATETTLVLMGRFNPRSSKPKRKAKASKTQPSPIPEEGQMDPKELRTRLGLAEDATDDEVLTAMVQHVPEVPNIPDPPAPAPAPAATTNTTNLPDGVVAIDAATLEDLKVAASQGRQAHESLRTSERDRYLDGAIRAGKFPPARREHYAAMYDKDETGTREFVDKLAAGTIPLSEIGHAANPEGEVSDDVFYREFFGNAPEFVTDPKGA